MSVERDNETVSDRLMVSAPFFGSSFGGNLLDLRRFAAAETRGFGVTGLPFVRVVSDVVLLPDPGGLHIGADNGFFVESICQLRRKIN